MLPGLFLALTLFLFGPAQLFLTNEGEFWFTPAQLFPPLLLLALGLTLLCFLILRFLPRKISLPAEGILCALTLLCYLQGNFLLISYGTLNGSAIDWRAFTGPMLLSDALWVLLPVLAVLFCIRKQETARRFLRLAAGLAVLAQALSLGASLLTWQGTDRGEDRYLSRAGEFELSQKGNTVVFLLDCFDARLFMSLQEKDPAWAESTLEDFVFLPDTAGGATRTKYAIPFILTGKTNMEERSYPAYLAAEYPRSPLMSALRAEGADAALYTNKAFVDLSLQKLFRNIADGTGEVSSPAGLALDFLKLTLFRYGPASLARYCWMYSGDFEKWKTSDAAGEYSLNDPLFYRELREQGLSVSTDAPVFRFYHLTGAHDPYTMDEQGRALEDGSGTEEGQALGCFTIISDYIARLKALGIYDNTTILILADHGSSLWGGVEQNPLFLIRPAGRRGPFEVSDMPFSYASLPSLLSRAVAGEPLPLSSWEAKGDRYFYVEREDSVQVNIEEYAIRGKAFDPLSPRLTGRVFHGDTLGYTGAYRLGTELSFGLGDSARSHIVSGFWRNDGTRTWTVGKRAEMRFVLAEPPAEDLLLTLTCSPFDGHQTVRVVVNGTPVETLEVEKEETLQIRLPREALTTADLRLVLEIPEARSPLSLGQGTDERELGLYMESLKLSSAWGSSLWDLSGLLLGRVMDLCCALLGSLGPALLLFTLLSKILLLPVSLWVHRNALKLVKLRPEINRLNIRHFGNRDAAAEGQAALYKREKYHPLASLLPLSVQILLLLGVIGAIRQPRPAYSALFLGLDLTRSAADLGGAALLLPLLAGLSSLILALAEKSIAPLQRVQRLPERAGTAAFSVLLSLYLGFFVSSGVVLYWILSNLLSIPVQLLMNRLIPPEKQVNWQEIRDTEAELDKLRHLEAGIPAGEKRKLRRREKADYRRFFSVSGKHLVFYSESNGFYKYFGPVLDEILSRSTAMIHYITSDPKDEIFRRAAENPRIRAYYIGPRKLITLFMMMDADVVVMTMPDLDNYHYKRSYVRKDVRYIYMFHYPLSTHMVLHTGALDHYDEILCVGDFQVPELRRQEELSHLSPRRLTVCGYCQLDSLYRDFQAMDQSPSPRRSVLIAPSWQEGNILDSCLDPLLEGLLGRGWDITVRPHPEYMKRFRPAMEEIQRRWAGYGGGDLRFETDFTSSRSIYASDVVITDWSGTAAEFSFVTLRPCIWIDTPPKINNPRWGELGIEPQELRLRDLIGLRLPPERAKEAGEKAGELIADAGAWAERIREIREELIAHFPDSAPFSARAILKAVLEQQQRRKEQEHDEA